MDIKVEVFASKVRDLDGNPENMSAAMEEQLRAFIDHLEEDSEPVRNEVHGPDGRQGGPEIIEIVQHVISNPHVIKGALTLLIQGLSNIASGQTKKNDQNDDDGKPSVISLLGKKIFLPASVAAISKFIEDVTSDAGE